METVVELEGSEKSKLEGTSAIVITCSESAKQIADPVVYKLARVEGDGRLVPATDDEVMEVEDLLDDKNSVHFVLDTCQPPLNHDTFSQDFMPMDCQGLIKVKDPCNEGGRSDTLYGTTVDLGKLNSQFEEINRPESTPIDIQIDQSDPLLAESEPSTSTISVSWKPDFSKLKGEVCLDNLSVRELHATFKATFGRETSVKDKQWLKRRISMGLSNSCDVSTTTFVIENNKITKKPKPEDHNDHHNNNNENQNQNQNQDQDPSGETNVSGNNIKITIGQSQSIQMEDQFSKINKSIQQSENANTPKSHVGSEDDNTGGKRVRKPTKRYIEASESESREHSGRVVSSVKSSGSGTRTRVRPIHNIQPVISKPLVTRQDSLGGSGVEIPYVSRIRRSRPRENFMSLMKFQPCGNASKLADVEIVKEVTTGWVEQPVMKEQHYSEQSGEMNMNMNNESDGQMDSYPEEEDDSDDENNNNILTVPTAKGGMRRKHHRPWTLSEVVKLVEGVSRYGAGRWSEIKRIAFATCSHRTAVDLKDKWRNLLRASFVQLPAEKGNAKKQSSIPIPAPILLRVRELAEMQSQVGGETKAVKFGGGSRNHVNDIKSGFL